jgi:hypothetical protein
MGRLVIVGDANLRTCTAAGGFSTECVWERVNTNRTSFSIEDCQLMQICERGYSMLSTSSHSERELGSYMPLIS